MGIMKKPSIVNCSAEERQKIIQIVEQEMQTPSCKNTVIEALDFINVLIEKLKSSNITIHQLKRMFGFNSEQLKKLMQIR